MTLNELRKLPVAQCANCHHAKMFHQEGGCRPIILVGMAVIESRDFTECDCKEFDNRHIYIAGDTRRRFSSVAEAREAGAL